MATITTSSHRCSKNKNVSWYGLGDDKLDDQSTCTLNLSGALNWETVIHKPWKHCAGATSGNSLQNNFCFFKCGKGAWGLWIFSIKYHIMRFGVRKNISLVSSNCRSEHVASGLCLLLWKRKGWDGMGHSCCHLQPSALDIEMIWKIIYHSRQHMQLTRNTPDNADCVLPFFKGL